MASARMSQTSQDSPRCTPVERALLVLLASRVRSWRSALCILQPDTLLRWMRQNWGDDRGHWVLRVA